MTWSRMNFSKVSYSETPSKPLISSRSSAVTEVSTIDPASERRLGFRRRQDLAGTRPPLRTSWHVSIHRTPDALLPVPREDTGRGSHRFNPRCCFGRVEFGPGDRFKFVVVDLLSRLRVLDEQASDMHEHRPFVYRKEGVAFVPSRDEHSVNVTTAEPVRLSDEWRLDPYQEQDVAAVGTHSLDAPAASRFLQPIAFTGSEEKVWAVQVSSSELRVEALHVARQAYIRPRAASASNRWMTAPGDSPVTAATRSQSCAAGEARFRADVSAHERQAQAPQFPPCSASVRVIRGRPIACGNDPASACRLETIDLQSDRAR